MTEINLVDASMDNPLPIDFSIPFDGDMEEYPHDNSFPSVTRANFTSFLVQTFYPSRGDRGAHLLVFDWYSAKTGQDIVGMVRSFYYAIRFDGSKLADVLSQKEIDYILEKLDERSDVRAHWISRRGLGEALAGELVSAATRTDWLRTKTENDIRLAEARLKQFDGVLTHINQETLSPMSLSTLVRNIGILVPKKTGHSPG